MTSRPAVFIDRDGTIIGDPQYLSDPADIVVIPGAFEALRGLREAGFVLVVVTNQAGIARGYYTVEDYRAVESRLDEILADAGAEVDRTMFCPHHPDFSGPCPCRKPGTGMYREAAADLGIDLEASYYIGDKVSDVLPALELGGQGILVRTGYGAEHEVDAPEGIWVVDDLWASVEPIRRALGR